MEAFSTHLTEAVSFIANSEAILGGAGGLAFFSVAGAIPRVGFVRALITVGWRSYFKKVFVVKSCLNSSYWVFVIIGLFGF